MNTLVLGLGNILLGDEAIGVRVVEKLRESQQAMENVTFLDGGTLSFTLADYIEQANNLIIVDAAQLHQAPGNVAVFEKEEMDRFIKGNCNKGVHEVNITDILSLAHLTGSLPAHRALVGIQPKHIAWSSDLSEPLAAAIPKACAAVQNLLNKWHKAE